MSAVSSRVSGILAAAAFTAGAGALAWAAFSTPAQLKRLERRASDLRTLRGIEADARRIPSTLTRLRDRPDPGSETPVDLLRRMDPEVSADARPPVAEDPFEGWTVRRYPIIINAIPPETMGRWIEVCGRPPANWRLARLNVLALDAEAREVRVDAVWERAERAGPAGK
jgi:hypothetical protein